MDISLDNRKLVTLLDQARIKDEAELMEEIFRMISEEAYFLAGVNFSKKPIPQKDGSFFLQKETDLSFPVLVNSEQDKYYPAFTDYMQIEKWHLNLDKTTIVNLCIDDFVEILNNDPEAKGIVINPFDQSFIIYKETLVHMLQVRKENHPFDQHHSMIKELQISH